jgi:selenocysteine lyase/cysteine desulfurase
MVDAAQIAGVFPINLRDSKIDYLCLSGHKGLYGPMGVGALVTEHGDKLNTIIEGGTGTNSISSIQPYTVPDKFESGTQNLSGIVGLGAGIEFIEKKNILKHEIEIISQFFDGLVNMDGVVMYMPRPTPEYFVPLISFNVKNKNSESIAELLNKYEIAVRAGLHCAPLAHKFGGTLEQGTIRICPSIFTKYSEVKYFLYVLKNVIKL